MTPNFLNFPNDTPKLQASGSPSEFDGCYEPRPGAGASGASGPSLGVQGC